MQTAAERPQTLSRFYFAQIPPLFPVVTTRRVTFDWVVDTETSTSLLDIYVPVYTGYRVSESFAVYLTPKYIMRAAFGSASSGDEESSSTEVFHIPAATLGVALGSSVEFLVEGTVGYDTVTEALVYTAGIGVGF